MPMTPTCQPSFASTSTRSPELARAIAIASFHNLSLNALAFGIVLVEQFRQVRGTRGVAGQQQFQRGHCVGQTTGRIEAWPDAKPT